MASSLASPLGRHLLVPSRDFGRAFYSSVLLYEIADRRLLVGARVAGATGGTLGMSRAVAAGSSAIRG